MFFQLCLSLSSHTGAKKSEYLRAPFFLPPSTSDILPCLSFSLNFLAQNKVLHKGGLSCCFLAWPEVRSSRKEPHK